MGNAVGDRCVFCMRITGLSEPVAKSEWKRFHIIYTENIPQVEKKEEKKDDKKDENKEDSKDTKENEEKTAE